MLNRMKTPVSKSLFSNVADLCHERCSMNEKE